MPKSANTEGPRDGGALAVEREQRKNIPQTSNMGRLSEAVLSQQLDRSLHDRIRERAYQLYEQHGRREGRADKDWLEAEVELLSNR
jgi:hypothetical protein